MTPALKAMVEAMLAEIRRQNVLDGTTADPPATATVVFVNGAVNLEKIARAGLEAVRDIDVPDWIAEGSAWAAPGRMIEVILKEQP